MQLTESKISQRKELFYKLSEYIINEEYKYNAYSIATEEEIAMAENVMRYFIEHYEEPSLEENINEDMTGYDINEELYLEIYSAILLDESIGSGIAKMVHGIGTALAKRKEQNALKARDSTKDSYISAYNKAVAHAANASNGGIFHKFKQTYLNTKANNANAKFLDKSKKANTARINSLDKQTKQTNLTNKIDNKLASIGHKIAHTIAGGKRGVTLDSTPPSIPETPKAIIPSVIKSGRRPSDSEVTNNPANIKDFIAKKRAETKSPKFRKLTDIIANHKKSTPIENEKSIDKTVAGDGKKNFTKLSDIIAKHKKNIHIKKDEVPERSPVLPKLEIGKGEHVASEEDMDELRKAIEKHAHERTTEPKIVPKIETKKKNLKDIKVTPEKAIEPTSQGLGVATKKDIKLDDKIETNPIPPAVTKTEAPTSSEPKKKNLKDIKAATKRERLPAEFQGIKNGERFTGNKKANEFDFSKFAKAQ